MKATLIVIGVVLGLWLITKALGTDQTSLDKACKPYLEKGWTYEQCINYLPKTLQ